jgi:methionyl-tRNA synthetase
MNLARVYATLAHPIMPVLSERILGALNVPLKWDFNLEEISNGHEIIVPDALFTKITPERVEELNEKYSGKV